MGKAERVASIVGTTFLAKIAFHGTKQSLQSPLTWLHHVSQYIEKA